MPIAVRCFLFLLFYASAVAQTDRYNVYELGKGKIFASDYLSLHYLYDDYLSAVSLKGNASDYEWSNVTGVINLNEEVIVPFAYRNIRPVQGFQYFDTHNPNQYPYVNVSDGKGVGLFHLADRKFTQINGFDNFQYRPIPNNPDVWLTHTVFRHHILRLSDQKTIRTTAENLYPLNSELIAFQNASTKQYGIMTIKGDTLVPPKFSAVQSYNDDYILVEKGDSIGLLNHIGKVLLPPVFHHIVNFQEGQSRFFVGTFNTGKPLKVSDAVKKELSDWSAVFNKAPRNIYSLSDKQIEQIGLFGAFDTNGKLVIPFEYDYLSKGIGSEIIASKNNRVGVLSEDGEVLVDFYESLSLAFDQLYVAKLRNKKGIFTKNGQVVLPLKYDDVFPISNERIVVLCNQKWHVVEVNNPNRLTPISLSPTVQLQYVSVHPYARPLYADPDFIQNHYFVIKQNGKYGITDSDFATLIPPEHTETPALYYNKMFVFGYGEKQVFYTKKGIKMEGVKKAEGDVETSALTETIICMKGDKFGVIDLNGNVLIPFEYKYIQNIDGKRFVVNYKL